MNDQSAPVAPAAPPPLVSGCAIASFVLAIIGLILCILGLLLTLISIVLGGIFVVLGAILCLLAVVLGIVGLIGRKRGKGMALAGLLIGALPVLGPAAGIGLFAPVKKVDSAGSPKRVAVSRAEKNTRNAVDKIKGASAAHAVTRERYPRSVEELVDAGFLDPRKDLKDGWGHDMTLSFGLYGLHEIRSAGPDGVMNTQDDLVY